MLAPIACGKQAWRSFGRLSGSQPSVWFWAWLWDPLKFMRRHPPHHLSPARANHPAGQDPEYFTPHVCAAGLTALIDVRIADFGFCFKT